MPCASIYFPHRLGDEKIEHKVYIFNCISRSLLALHLNRSIAFILDGVMRVCLKVYCPSPLCQLAALSLRFECRSCNAAPCRAVPRQLAFVPVDAVSRCAALDCVQLLGAFPRDFRCCPLTVSSQKKSRDSDGGAVKRLQLGSTRLRNH